MNYIYEEFYGNFYKHNIIKEIKEWICDNALQSEIDVSIEELMEISGMKEPYTKFGCKTEESAVAFKLRWL